MYFSVHHNNMKASVPLAQTQTKYTKSIKKDCRECEALLKQILEGDLITKCTEAAAEQK